MNAETRAHLARMGKAQQLEIADNQTRLDREFRRASAQRHRPQAAGKLTYKALAALAAVGLSMRKGPKSK